MTIYMTGGEGTLGTAVEEVRVEVLPDPTLRTFSISTVKRGPLQVPVFHSHLLLTPDLTDVGFSRKLLSVSLETSVLSRVKRTRGSGGLPRK